MPDQPKIAQLSAEVTASGSKLSPEGLRFDMQINSVPTVKVSFVYPGQDEVIAPVSQDVISRISALQSARLAGPKEPDLVVKADDGLGGSMEFKAFSTAPILDISTVSTNNQITGVGVDAMLNALDLSFYWSTSVVSRKESNSGDGVLKAIPAAQDGDLPALLKEITEILVANYDKTLAGESMPVSKELVRIRHELNTSGSPSPLELWKRVLEESEVTFDSWEEICAKSPSVARSLSENARKMLTAKQPGFWNKIRTLMSAFQMHYVPTFSGSGHFERADTKVMYPDTQASYSVRSISVADGSPNIVQLGGVVMMAPGSRRSREESDEIPTVGRVMAFAPKNGLRPGFIHEEVPPFWLVQTNGVPILGTEVSEAAKGNSDSDEVNLDLKQFKKDKETGKKYKQEVDAISEGVMTELCEVIYQEMQLSHSTAVITIPLDFNQNDNIGKRAVVRLETADGSDGGSFDAFIAGLTHVIDLRQGKQLNSYTQVRCTHVSFN
jgi:hypothetical protein